MVADWRRDAARGSGDGGTELRSGMPVIEVFCRFPKCGFWLTMFMNRRFNLRVLVEKNVSVWLRCVREMFESFPSGPGSY